MFYFICNLRTSLVKWMDNTSYPPSRMGCLSRPLLEMGCSSEMDYILDKHTNFEGERARVSTFSKKFLKTPFWPVCFFKKLPAALKICSKRVLFWVYNILGELRKSIWSTYKKRSTNFRKYAPPHKKILYPPCNCLLCIIKNLRKKVYNRLKLIIMNLCF